MNEATVALTIMTLLILAIFLGFLIWGIRSRQFKNIEDAKYHMMNDGSDYLTDSGSESREENRQ